MWRKSFREARWLNQESATALAYAECQFTNSDIFIFLLVAAEAGPYALAAALDAVATLFGGPIGTVIGIILDIIGFATLANFAYLIFQAAWAGEGVYFGIDWTPWPNYTQGLWCGCN